MHIHNAIYNTIHKDGIFLSKASGIADFLLLYIKTPALLQVYENTYTITDPSVIIISGYSPYKYLSVTKPTAMIISIFSKRYGWLFKRIALSFK